MIPSAPLVWGFANFCHRAAISRWIFFLFLFFIVKNQSFQDTPSQSMPSSLWNALPSHVLTVQLRPSACWGPLLSFYCPESYKGAHVVLVSNDRGLSSKLCDPRQVLEPPFSYSTSTYCTSTTPCTTVDISVNETAQNLNPLWNGASNGGAGRGGQR